VGSLEAGVQISKPMQYSEPMAYVYYVELRSLLSLINLLYPE